MEKVLCDMPWTSTKARKSTHLGLLLSRFLKVGVDASFQLNAFSDPNGDPLTYSVSGLPAGMWFDAASRTINGSASAGSYAITIHANDGCGGVGTATFTLTVQANNAPAAPAIATMNMQVGTGVGVVLPAFSDPDSDPVTHNVPTLPPGLWWDEPGRVEFLGRSSLAFTRLLQHDFKSNSPIWGCSGGMVPRNGPLH